MASSSDHFHSVQLSVSRSALKCEHVVQNLLRAGIMASVTQNHSVVCDATDKCRIESGCRIVFNRISRDELRDAWQMLRANHTLDCAHLNVPTVFAGCVYDFLQPSVCPWKSRAFGEK